MKGSRRFNNNFIENNTRKTQRKEFTRLRNELILHRYYYYGKYREYRFDIILEKLGDEFYIGTGTVQNIISEDKTIIKNLINNHPEKKYFKTRWPHFTW